MKIGELASLLNCKAETIRYYEKEGLLPKPERNASNYRHYGEEHVKRLRFIRNCRSLDMTHDEIRTLLMVQDESNGNCACFNQVIDEHLGHVDARIQELVYLKEQLIALQKQCETAQAVENCGIFRQLSTMESTEPPTRHSHL